MYSKRHKAVNTFLESHRNALNAVLTSTLVLEVWLLQRAGRFCAASSGPVFVSFNEQNRIMSIYALAFTQQMQHG